MPIISERKPFIWFCCICFTLSYRQEMKWKKNNFFSTFEGNESDCLKINLSFKTYMCFLLLCVFKFGYLYIFWVILHYYILPLQWFLLCTAQLIQNSQTLRNVRQTVYVWWILCQFNCYLEICLKDHNKLILFA